MCEPLRLSKQRVRREAVFLLPCAICVVRGADPKVYTPLYFLFVSPRRKAPQSHTHTLTHPHTTASFVFIRGDPLEGSAAVCSLHHGWRRQMTAQLLAKCAFQMEESSSSSTQVDMRVVRTYVDRGRARLTPVADGLFSVAVKEGSQGDTRGLFCGARSLVIAGDTGDIHVRGVNKFFDVDHVGCAWAADESSDVWGSCTVYAQRKMAGFVATLFSLDGVRLQCMSKHALEGPHVDIAAALLDECLSPHQQLKVAQDLFALDAAASCECISLSKDFHHPVMELAAYDRGLVLFAVQRRRTLQEQAMPFALVQRKAREWGLPCTQGHQLATPAAVEDALVATRSWNADYKGFGSPSELAEGLVLLVEVPQHHSTAWVRPLRLKAKTTAYITLRSLRSLLRGDAHSCLLLYHKAVMAWASTRAPSAAVTFLREMEEKGGVTLVHRSFLHAVLGDHELSPGQRRRRHRGAAATVGEAYQELLRITECQVVDRPMTACASSARPGVSAAEPRLTTLLFCGVPGSGKSTLSEQLLRSLSLVRECRYGYGVILKRDEVTRTVSEKVGVTAESSKHKRRRLGPQVHREMLRRIAQIHLFAALADAPVLLLFDACNATPDTRRVWSHQVAPQALTATQREREAACRIVYVECAQPALLAERVGARPTHELLPDAERAQQALYNVRTRFVPPTPEENAVRVDTATQSLQGNVQQLVSVIEPACVQPCKGTGGHRFQPLTYAELEETVTKREDGVLHALLGVEHFHSSPTAQQLLDSVRIGGSGRKASARTVIAVMLDPASFRDGNGRSVVADALVRALTPSTSATTERPTLLSRLSAGVRGALLSPFGLTPDDPPKTVAGHTRWLAGWLFRGRPTVPTRSSVAAALAERFDDGSRALLAPHVTLLHSVDENTGVEEFWSESGLRLNERVSVAVDGILMDRLAVCLSAKLTDSGRMHQWCGEVGPAPTAEAEEQEEDYTSANRGDAVGREAACGPRLHITVGVAPGVKGGYCGEMFENFKEWEAQNTALQARQEKSLATRSHEKHVNFLHLALPKPLTLYGTVKDVSQPF